MSIKRKQPPKSLQSGRQYTTVALAGNPNVGKSTVFNALTGMNQHTGNWPGKTVESAKGICKGAKTPFELVDLPGTYSLLSHSPEEEIARNFICFDSPDAVIVVCDATAIERNLNLVLQIIECASRTLVCVNLLDEAKRKQIKIDLEKLQALLGVRVIGITARRKDSLSPLLQTLDEVRSQEVGSRTSPVRYPTSVESAIDIPVRALGEKQISLKGLTPRFVALKLLEGNEAFLHEMKRYLGRDLSAELSEELLLARRQLQALGSSQDSVTDLIAKAFVSTAEQISASVVRKGEPKKADLDARLDRILTGKWTAYPIMLLLLGLVFWITISLANYPSAWLSALFSFLLSCIGEGLSVVGAPEWVQSVLLDGVLLVLARVVSVMLPPMAIFFPLFTILEDAGYLPRVAYNLDRPFAACSACGKQALTTCMGFGCNAVGVTGCRIIDSPRERLLAILTNSLVPCNGRFPALIAILSMFFVIGGTGLLASLHSALLLTLLILLSLGATLLCTWLLSRTLLKGIPSSFCLEIPPFRPPQIKKVLLRSVLDRTLFVLGRAVTVALPAGLVLWLLTNLFVGGESLFSHCANFLDPFAQLLGLDGCILMAFILGFPANEIVIPILTMAYLQSGSMVELSSIADMKLLFTENGWTPVTAVCVLIFFLFHWPCSTTLWTVKKETGSIGWTVVAACLPTVLGMLLCALIHLVFG